MYKKEFLALRDVWYKKLKKSGFKDIEAYHKDYVNCFDSPHLNRTLYALRQNYSPELVEHHRLCRLYLATGPFYPNLRENLASNVSLRRRFKNFKNYKDSFPVYWTKAQSTCFALYTEGLTIRKISDELRRLHSLRYLKRPPHSRKRSKPFSVFWVKTHLDKIIKHALVCEDAEAVETIEEFMSSNTPSF